MNFIKYIFLFLSVANLLAQENTEKQFFSDLFKNRISKVIYSENRFYDLNELKNTINQAKVVYKMQLENSPIILLDSLFFTNQELEIVFNKIMSSNDTHWAKNSILNGKYIPRKKIDKIFNEPSKGWDYFHKIYGKDLFSFSKPVFIRNNSVCFFYESNGNGNLGGSGSFDIYIKQNGKWIFFNSLRMWIS